MRSGAHWNTTFKAPHNTHNTQNTQNFPDPAGVKQGMSGRQRAQALLPGACFCRFLSARQKAEKNFIDLKAAPAAFPRIRISRHMRFRGLHVLW
jgi:hypothetical protein